MDNDIHKYRAVSRKIGQGSFASIWSIGRIAFKVSLLPTGVDTLEQEFEHMQTIYTTCAADCLFTFPRALAFTKLNTLELDVVVSSSPTRHRDFRRKRPAIDAGYFEELRTHDLNTAAFAMSRIERIPFKVARYIRSRYYLVDKLPDVKLCRVYLGKLSSPQSRFINTDNFILDLERYKDMSAHLDLPSAEDIAHSMGQTLGRLNFAACLDGRDIEFVLAGSADEEPDYFCLDFNQCRRWDPAEENIHQLVDAFFANDPYYPRPSQDDALWKEFKMGYCTAVTGQQTLATKVVEALEAKALQKGG